jgi:hypothetical protein
MKEVHKAIEDRRHTIEVNPNSTTKDAIDPGRQLPPEATLVAMGDSHPMDHSIKLPPNVTGATIAAPTMRR